MVKHAHTVSTGGAASGATNNTTPPAYTVSTSSEADATVPTRTWLLRHAAVPLIQGHGQRGVHKLPVQLAGLRQKVGALDDDGLGVVQAVPDLGVRQFTRRVLHHRQRSVHPNTYYRHIRA